MKHISRHENTFTIHFHYSLSISLPFYISIFVRTVSSWTIQHTSSAPSTHKWNSQWEPNCFAPFSSVGLIHVRTLHSQLLESWNLNFFIRTSMVYHYAPLFLRFKLQRNFLRYSFHLWHFINAFISTTSISTAGLIHGKFGGLRLKNPLTPFAPRKDCIQSK